MSTKKTAKADVGKIFKINEKALQQAVIELAHFYGWRVHHTRAVQLPSGRWATPVKETTVSLIWCWYALPTSSSSS